MARTSSFTSEQRSTAALLAIQGKVPLREIADRLNTTVANVNNWKARALKAVEEAFVDRPKATTAAPTAAAAPAHDARTLKLLERLAGANSIAQPPTKRPKKRSVK